MLFHGEKSSFRWWSWLRWIGWPAFWVVYGALTLVASGVSLVTVFFARVRRVFSVWKKALKLVTGGRAVVSIPVRSKLPILLLAFIGVVGFGWWMGRNLPQPQQLIRRDQAVTTKIYDRNGVLLYKIYNDQNRSVVPLKEIPKHVIDATIAIEDARFYQHPGFSLRGILRAFSRNLQTESTQGGSTITQQLVKNTLLSSERTFVRKIKELVLSLEVEYLFTKDEILSMYFNEVGYGGTAYGIEEAAQQYFGKSVREVNLAEAALLAGLPQSPTIYSPFGAQPDLAISRQHGVLKRMVEERFISAEEAEVAKTTPLVFATPTTSITAPHFVMYVKDLLVKLYGEEVVRGGGLSVTTTLDVSVQKMAEAAVEKELQRLAGLHVTNGAALVTNPKTGEILAMVGSKDYFDTAHDGQVNITIRPRQPGSSIKPLTYAYALQNRMVTPSTLIDDAPVVYRTPGSPPYAPQNYDGAFHGKVTVRQALANSYNIPAVKTLSQIGVANLVSFGQKMGITTWTDPSRFGLSLTLGGGEVRMVDMAEVYGTIANGGFRVPLSPLMRVTDYAGKIDDVYACSLLSTNNVLANRTDGRCGGAPIIDASTAYALSDILSDNQARSAAFGSHSVLVIPNHQVAVKTGTTNDLRDNWTFGYTPDYLTATWVGNNDNTSMSRVVSGITGASPIWNVIMTSLLLDAPAQAFSPPKGMVSVWVCPLTSSLTCKACPSPKQEYFVAGTEPKFACTDELIQRALMTPPPEPNRDRLLNGSITN